MSTKCKRCGAEDVYWTQSLSGKWNLLNKSDDRRHFCEDGKLKVVKCKYCSSDDLHWAEEIDPITQVKKMVLTENYGLPHACDERISFLAKEKQDKKDKYDAKKKCVNATPDGVCAQCCGSGYGLNPSQMVSEGVCSSCYGYRVFSQHTRKAILRHIRLQIWPHLRDQYDKW